MTKENQDIILLVQRESYPDTKLIHKMLNDSLLSIIGVNYHCKNFTLFSKTVL